MIKPFLFSFFYQILQLQIFVSGALVPGLALELIFFIYYFFQNSIII
jgi:hypothetical protein